MPGFGASLGGQKYHASPHKAMFNERKQDGENKKVHTAEKQEEVKGA